MRNVWLIDGVLCHHNERHQFSLDSCRAQPDKVVDDVNGVGVIIVITVVNKRIIVVVIIVIVVDEVGIWEYDFGDGRWR